MLQGFQALWSEDRYEVELYGPHAWLKACPAAQSTGSGQLPLIAIMTTCSVLVLCAVVILLATIVRPKGYRSAAKRAWDHVKWRLQGMPYSGTISVVVTDIEGYSGGCLRAYLS